MDKPLELKFGISEPRVYDVTGRLPQWSGPRISYTNAERIIIPAGDIICQFYSHILFFIEIVEFKLESELIASFYVNEPSLFLFMVLEGKITFFTSDGKLITEAPEHICYATYNREGLYHYKLSAGTHRFCYLSPMPIWVIRHLSRYPRFKPFMESMKHSQEQFAFMSACRMDQNMFITLENLLIVQEDKEDDLEATLSKQAKKVIDNYQRLLDAMFARRAYLMKYFLEEHFADPLLNNKTIAYHFNTTEKTAARDFRKEFKITLHAYLIQLRMNRARQMLVDNISVNSVYQRVGYNDLRSFSKQFKIFFGFSPSIRR